MDSGMEVARRKKIKIEIKTKTEARKKKIILKNR